MSRTALRAALAVALGVSAPLFASAECTLPQSLQSRLRAHPGPEIFIQIGDWFEEKLQYGCAANAYRSALKLAPNSARIYDRLGSSLYNSGDLKGAVSALQQSTKLASEVIEPHLKLAAALEKLQRKDEAKAQWEAAVKIDPKSIPALNGLSAHLVAESNYGPAIDLLRSAPANDDLVLTLVEAYGKSGMLDEAAETATKALTQDPSSFPLTYALAVVKVNQGLLLEAEQLMEKFAKSHGENLEAQSAYLRMLVLNSNWRLAEPLARDLLSRAPRGAYVLYVNGMIERKNGDYASARDHLRQAVMLDPDFYNSHYNLGLTLAKLNDLRGAKEQFERAIALGGQEPEIRFQLSRVLRALGENEEADKQLNLYRQTADNQLQAYRETREAESKRDVAQGKSSLADKELASGNAQKAAGLYQEALQAAPEDAMLNFKLSVALDKAGDLAGERLALEKAVRIDPDLAIAHNQLGYLISRTGDSASAEEHFREAVRAAPGYTEAWINLAATLGMESKFPEAREAVARALRLDPKNTQAQQLQHDLEAAPIQR